MQVVRPDGVRKVAATHTADGVRVVGVDDYQVDIAPKASPYALMVDNVDRPGMIGRVGSLLGELAVNISYMSVAPGTGDRALMVLGTNRALTDAEIATVTGVENVFGARQVDLS